jgi:hypothetical protein
VKSPKSATNPAVSTKPATPLKTQATQRADSKRCELGACVEGGPASASSALPGVSRPSREPRSEETRSLVFTATKSSFRLSDAHKNASRTKFLVPRPGNGVEAESNNNFAS